MTQQINPVQRQRADHNSSRVFLFGLCVKHDPHTRRASRDNRESVKIKCCHSAQQREHKWVPFPGGEKVPVEKLNRGTCHATRDARQTGDLVKCATRPWQTERKPARRYAERSQRNTQPKQFVISFIRADAAT